MSDVAIYREVEDGECVTATMIVDETRWQVSAQVEGVEVAANPRSRWGVALIEPLGATLTFSVEGYGRPSPRDIADALYELLGGLSAELCSEEGRLLAERSDTDAFWDAAADERRVG
jgi:hypothetical protein